MYRKRLLAVAFLGITIILIISAPLVMPSYNFLKSNGVLLTEKRDRLAGYETNTIVRTLTKVVKDVNTRLAVFPPSEVASPLVADFIDPILAAKTDSIRILGFSYERALGTDQAAIKITGSANDRNALLAFADRLRNIGTFSDVNVPVANFIKDADVPFTISATVALK